MLLQLGASQAGIALQLSIVLRDYLQLIQSLGYHQILSFSRSHPVERADGNHPRSTSRFNHVSYHLI